MPAFSSNHCCLRFGKSCGSAWVLVFWAQENAAGNVSEAVTSCAKFFCLQVPVVHLVRRSGVGYGYLDLQL